MAGALLPGAVLLLGDVGAELRQASRGIWRARIPHREDQGPRANDERCVCDARSGADRRRDPEGGSGDADDSSGRRHVGDAVRVKTKEGVTPYGAITVSQS